MTVKILKEIITTTDDYYDMFAKINQELTKDKIELLEEHVEHPSKPGYKRHDILDKIELLKQSI